MSLCDSGTSWRFGKYVPRRARNAVVSIPIFWDVPRANIHAIEDIGAVVDWLTERCEFHADAKSNLAVLHNRNDMTNLFRASNWVSSSHDSIVSRGVTTCAGMTAHTVLLAQTKVGFLTGGRKKYFLALPEDEQMVQLKEAYARATVAITRARALCLIMGPLDMKGLLGAATVMGTLMYGAGHVWAGHSYPPSVASVGGLLGPSGPETIPAGYPRSRYHQSSHKSWCQKLMASVFRAAEGVLQHGPSHCWVAFFPLPWSRCIGTMSGATPGRWVVSNN